MNFIFVTTQIWMGEGLVEWCMVCGWDGGWWSVNGCCVRGGWGEWGAYPCSMFGGVFDRATRLILTLRIKSNGRHWMYMCRVAH